METKKITKITDIILEIKNNQHDNILQLLNNYVYNNFTELNDQLEKLLLLFKEISKKTNKEIDIVIEEFIKNINKNEINEKLLDYLNEFFNKETWKYISSEIKLSENFIDKHANKVDWFYVSKNQTLSKRLIEKYDHKIFWFYVLKIH